MTLWQKEVTIQKGVRGPERGDSGARVCDPQRGRPAGCIETGPPGVYEYGD